MKEMLSNKILNRLTDSEFARLMPSLEPVSLIAGERLAETGEQSPVYLLSGKLNHLLPR